MWYCVFFIFISKIIIYAGRLWYRVGVLHGLETKRNYTTCTISITPPSICNTNQKLTFEVIGGLITHWTVKFWTFDQNQFDNIVIAKPMAPLSFSTNFLSTFSSIFAPVFYPQLYVSADIENELSKLNSHWMKIAKSNVHMESKFLV